jgi:hypothetical protein
VPDNQDDLANVFNLTENNMVYMRQILSSFKEKWEEN